MTTTNCKFDKNINEVMFKQIKFNTPTLPTLINSFHSVGGFCRENTKKRENSFNDLLVESFSALKNLYQTHI